MKTIQMTLDEKLVTEVDRVVRRLGTTRSAFTRRALGEALARVREEELDRRHREGYRKKPVRPGEFDPRAGEQDWGDSW